MNRIHRKYLFSKINVIIILSIILIACICYLFTIDLSYNTYEQWLNRNEVWINFHNTTLFVGKFIGIILAAYIMGTGFASNIDGYNVLFLRNKKNRIGFFISKTITINIIVFLIIEIIGMVGLIIISSFSSWFNYFKELFSLFFNLAFLSLVYGNISIILILIFKTTLVVVIPLVLFVMIEVLIDQSFINYLLVFIPTIHLESNLYTTIHLITLIVIYNFISCIIYYKKDFA